MNVKDKLVGINPCISLDNGSYALLDVVNQEIKIYENEDSIPDISSASIAGSKSNTAKIIFSTTYNCNLNCQYCYVRGGDSEPILLSSKVAIKSLEYLLEKDLDEITIQFFGGEPTLNMSCIREVVEYLKENRGKVKINYEVSTNGLITDEMLEFFIQNDFLFIISLDGPEDIHNFQRPARSSLLDSYKTTEKTIKRILEATDMLKIRTTITSFSVEKMEEIVVFFHSLGIKLIHFEVFSPLGRGEDLDGWRPDADVYVKNFFKAYKKAGELNIQITQFGVFDLFNPSNLSCASSHKYKFVVMPTGEILFCLGAQEEFKDIAQEFTLGYCDEEKIDIDEGKAKNLPYKYDVDKMDKCDGCFIKYVCKGVCPALNSVTNGSWDIPDEYSCKIRKGIIRGIIEDLAK